MTRTQPVLHTTCVHTFKYIYSPVIQTLITCEESQGDPDTNRLYSDTTTTYTLKNIPSSVIQTLTFCEGF